MKKNTLYIFVWAIFIVSNGCSKSDFLNEKSRSDIVQPKTVADFQQLLDYPTIQQHISALPALADDDYAVNAADWESSITQTERNSYVWARDLYGGDEDMRDWWLNYQLIFYCNNVLEGLAEIENQDDPGLLYVKGQALFKRAYAFYDLARNYCNVYDEATAGADLGIPLRTNAGISELTPRSTLQETYDRILGDLQTAYTMLPADRGNNLFRPTKVAVDALLARIYLDMRKYDKAESHVTASLGAYGKLLDFNDISITDTRPFTRDNVELIYNSMTVGFYYFTSNATGSPSFVTPELIELYNADDLRLQLFYAPHTNGTYKRKNGYFGSGSYPFTGLATDEMYLIKAECLARRGETTAAMDTLNNFLRTRFRATVPYVPVTASNAAEALQYTLQERRKELVGRCLRWQDLKRLNKEGANITLTRSINGVVYTLPPNDPRYIFPIHPKEIALSGIVQNPR
jgi:SusD family.